MTFLLDVNVLIALIDRAHVQHDFAHEWFAAEGHRSWSSCPITQNGVLRIVGSPRYPNSPGMPAIVRLLRELFLLPGHSFWPDDISLLDVSRIDPSKLLSSGQLTDTYLLALAVARGGQLASFDQRLVSNAVRHSGGILKFIG